MGVSRLPTEQQARTYGPVWYFIHWQEDYLNWEPEVSRVWPTGAQRTPSLLDAFVLRVSQAMT